jgi:hypothetical protein
LSRQPVQHEWAEQLQGAGSDAHFNQKQNVLSYQNDPKTRVHGQVGKIKAEPIGGKTNICDLR